MAKIFDRWKITETKGNEVILKGIKTEKEVTLPAVKILKEISRPHWNLTDGNFHECLYMDFGYGSTPYEWGIDPETSEIVSKGDILKALYEGNGDISFASLESGDVAARSGKLWLILKGVEARIVKTGNGRIGTRIHDVPSILIEVAPDFLFGEKLEMRKNSFRKQITGFDSIVAHLEDEQIYRFLMENIRKLTAGRLAFAIFGEEPRYDDGSIFYDIGWDTRPLSTSVDLFNGDWVPMDRYRVSGMASTSAFYKEGEFSGIYSSQKSGPSRSRFTLVFFDKELVNRAASATVNLTLPPSETLLEDASMEQYSMWVQTGDYKLFRGLSLKKEEA